MKKLLVAFDGSETSKRALQHAVDRAKNDSSLSIHLVTAHESPIFYPEIGLTVPYEKLVELAAGEAARIQEPAERLMDAAGVRYTEEIVGGHIANAIADRANQDDVAGVVMGTRGMSALKSLVLGSVASQVVHLAHAPVTLVK